MSGIFDVVLEQLWKRLESRCLPEPHGLPSGEISACLSPSQLLISSTPSALFWGLSLCLLCLALLPGCSTDRATTGLHHTSASWPPLCFPYSLVRKDPLSLSSALLGAGHVNQGSIIPTHQESLWIVLFFGMCKHCLVLPVCIPWDLLLSSTLCLSMHFSFFFPKL